jgi:polyvinyl alcohol dehydrogenase (cytochrome)
MRFALLLTAAATALAQAPDGAALFRNHCAACHAGEGDARAPSLEAMRPRAPEAILTALVSGSMRVQGSRLGGPERRAIAEHITGRKISGDVAGSATGRCSEKSAAPNFASGPRWNGWGASPANTRFQPEPEAGLTASLLPRLKLKWAFGFPDAIVSWAQPSVVGGRVFVGSQNGTVYALDARTGCIYWTFGANGGVRTTVSIGPRSGSNSFAAYFGDTSANLYALDAATGRQLWVRKLDSHPLARVTASPALHKGRLYVGLSSYEEAQGADPHYECCSFRGSLSAVDAHTGAIVWKTYTIEAEPKPRGKSSAGKTLWGPSGAAIWSSPTIDEKRGDVYAATGNTYSNPAQPRSDAVIAFALDTGRIRWTRQVTPNDTFLSGCRGAGNANCPEPNGPDHDFGNAPILTRLADGRDVIVIGQKSGVGFAMDPDKEGAVLWQYRAGQGGALGGIQWGSAVDARHAYFAVSDITRPRPGGLHAVHLGTGERAWLAPPPPLQCAPGRGCNAAQAAAITVLPGAVLSGSNDGALRAYSTRDGVIMWEYDTNREFETVNGVPARGASMQGPGPVAAGGMLFVNSGYGAFGGRPGNVLLAFALD